jgi:hypothetical protein
VGGGGNSASRVTLPLHSSVGSNSSPYLMGGIVGVAVERRDHHDLSSSLTLVRRLFTENPTSSSITTTAVATATTDTETVSTSSSSSSSSVIVLSQQPSRIPTVSSLSPLASPRRYHTRLTTIHAVTKILGAAAEEEEEEEEGVAASISSTSMSPVSNVTTTLLPLVAATTIVTPNAAVSRRRLFSSPPTTSVVSPSTLKPPRPPFSSPERTAIHEAARVESASAARRVASRLARQRLRTITTSLLKNNNAESSSPPTTTTLLPQMQINSRAAARASTRASWLFSTPAVSFEPVDGKNEQPPLSVTLSSSSTTLTSPPLVPVTVFSQNASKSTTFEFLKGNTTKTLSLSPEFLLPIFSTSTTPLPPSRSPNDNFLSPATDPMIVSITTPTNNSPLLQFSHHHHVGSGGTSSGKVMPPPPPRAIAYIF